jgi:hypothetical protein
MTYLGIASLIYWIYYSFMGLLAAVGLADEKDTSPPKKMWPPVTANGVHPENQINGKHEVNGNDGVNGVHD